MTPRDVPRACYIHIPFCARHCPYCDFAVVVGREEETERYGAAVLSEIARETPAGPLDAVFIGGGTPSAVPAALTGRLIGALVDRHGMEQGAEVSLESNPEDLGGSLSHELIEAGVNRLSIGAQSLDPGVLTALGRGHEPGEVITAIENARAAGMHSVSVDLIFGHPSETELSWRRTLKQVVAAGPDHVSTYALTVERGTALSRAIAAGAPSPDDDTLADRFEAARTILGDAGYVHYEVSNHARPGHECQYNLRVWHNEPYLAYGLGAHGYRDGVRYRNVRALDAYLDRSESGASVRQGEDVIGPWESELERLMLGLRLRGGVPAGEAGKVLVGAPAWERLRRAGIVSFVGNILRVEKPLFTDAVIREVLALSPPAG